MKLHPSAMVRRRGGFTLIEILVVVVIIAILAAVVVPNVLGRIEDSKQSAALSDITAFNNALDQYKLDCGDYPGSLDGLVNRDNPKWNGPYFKNQSTIPMDPWGHPYLYKKPGDNGRDYDIISNGKDGSMPIKSWDPKGTGAK